MTLELLVSAMNKEPLALAQEMHIDSDALIVSQGEEYTYEETPYKEHRIRYYSMAERGVGLSRNHVLMRAQADVGLFADEDIVYVKDYEKLVLEAFRDHPQADMLLFNVKASPGRETYHIEQFGRVRTYNCGRYPTYSFAVKVEAVRRRNITFHLYFGGGARYSNGEDSLFIQECIHKGMKVYRVPVTIGQERTRESTWFKGYNKKFFYDRGVLYHYLYGRLAGLMAARFIWTHKENMCKDVSPRQAFSWMGEGIREAGK